MQNGPPACGKCGARLAADNRDELCGPCARGTDDTSWRPPVKPPEFWTQPRLANALARRHFGRVLRAYREAHEPELPQRMLASWLGISQGQISRIEKATTPLAHTHDRLERWATTLGVPQKLLWFQPSYASAVYAVNTTGSSLPPKVDGGDVQRRQFVKTVVGASLLAGRPAAARATPEPTGDPATEIREMTAKFRRLDNQVGGGRGRAVIGTYLRTIVQPLVRDVRGNDGARAALFTAAAEMHHLAGWMAYDVGQPDEGNRLLHVARRLCQEARDDALTGEMFAGMSHQAAFHGSAKTAADLAGAARNSAARAGLPALQSEAAAMEAHALAIRNDTSGCMAALRKAELTFNAAEDSDRPDWLSYFDHAYLAAKFGHTFRELGKPREAEVFARRSLEMSDGYDRGKLFNLSLLASTLADQRHVEEACATASAAVRMTDDVRSIRSAAYLADVSRRLAPFNTAPVVRGLLDEMREAGIPA